MHACHAMAIACPSLSTTRLPSHSSVDYVCLFCFALLCFALVIWDKDVSLTNQVKKKVHNAFEGRGHAHPPFRLQPCLLHYCVCSCACVLSSHLSLPWLPLVPPSFAIGNNNTTRKDT